MKKTVLMMLVVIMVFAFSACSNSKNTPESHSEKEKQSLESKSDNSEGEKQNIKTEYDIAIDKHLKIGDFIQFGTYEQSDGIGIGPERIEWQVIDIQYGKIFQLQLVYQNARQRPAVSSIHRLL